MKPFFNSKDEKITEKAFSQNLIISVVSILLCLVALCSMTYAWYTGEVSSNSNTLMSGTFDITIAVVDATAEDIAVKPDPSNPGVYQCVLAQGTYTVTLTLTEESTVKGHCVVKVGNDSPKQHTAAIIGEQTENQEGRETTDPFQFTIEVTEDKTTVTFEPRWGEVAEPAIYPMPKSTDDGDDPAQEPSVSVN